jgi:hypothetical protein
MCAGDQMEYARGVKVAGRTCIFCGASVDSAEDVIPRWMFSVLPQLPEYLPKAFSLDYFTPEPGPRKILRRMPAKNPERRARFVCRRCNNGWMSRLEVRCKPILTPMILGHRQALTPGDQEAISLWSLKSVMVGQYLQRDRLCIPQEQLRQLYATQRPLANATVKVGRRHTESSRIVRWNYAKIAQGVDLYIATVAFGELLIQVADFGARFGLPPAADEYLCQIWPASDSLVTVPPGRYIDEVGGFDALAAAFNPRWLPDQGAAEG